MKKKIKKISTVVLLGILTSACTPQFYKNLDDRYLRPGAKDPAIPDERNVYMTRTMKLIGKYRITHQWLPFGCQLAPMINFSEVAGLKPTYFRPIIEIDGSLYSEPFIKQEKLTKYDNVDKYFKSIKETRPIYGKKPNGALDTNNVIGEEIVEVGRQEMCATDWQGINAFISLYFFDRQPIELSKEFDAARLAKSDITRTRAVIGQNDWIIHERTLQLPKGNNVSTGYKHYYTNILDSGYVLKLVLGATQESMKNPEAFAAIEKTFMRLVEKIEIAPWTEEDERKQESMRQVVVEFIRQDCIEVTKSGRRSKAYAYCDKYMTLEPAVAK